MRVAAETHRRQSLWLVLATVIICIAAWIIQSRILLNRDASWLIEASRRMLADGTYSKDFFENNPPWILYVYSPVVLLSDFFHLGIATSLRLFVFALIVLSASLCWLFLGKIFNERDSLLKHIFYLVLLVSVVSLSLNEFGQREHLLLILSLPYFLMITCRLENKSLNPWLAVCVGFLAGMGFLIKPFFLLSLILIELFFMCRIKKLTAVIRPETIAIFCLGVVYAILLVTRHSDYLFIVAPFAARWHGLANNVTWQLIMLQDSSLYCLVAFIFFLIRDRQNQYGTFIDVLAVALTGFYFSYLLQGNFLYYHILPALCVAIMLYILIIGLDITYKEKKLSLYVKYSLFAILLLPFLFGDAIFLQQGIFLYPGLFNWLFLDTSAFIIALLFVVMSLYCFMSGSVKTRLNKLFFIFFGIGVLLTPITDFISDYITTLKDKREMQPLEMFVDKNAAGHSVYFFTTRLEDVFPTITDTKNTTSASRFSYFWPLIGVSKQRYLPMTAELKKQQMKDRNLVTDMVVEDINEKKPELVFVDVRAKNYVLVSTVIDKKTLESKLQFFPYDYLQDFSQYSQFQLAWKSYHYLTTIEDHGMAMINPFQFHILLSNRNIPADDSVKTNNLYVYLNKGDLEYAFKAYNNDIERIKIVGDKHILSSDDINAIKQELMTTGAILNQQNKGHLFLYIAKNRVPMPLYKFKVYKRDSS